MLLPSQLSTDLGPDFSKGHLRALLSVAGWSHLLRLAWPKVRYPTIRPALLEADWSRMAGWIGAGGASECQGGHRVPPASPTTSRRDGRRAGRDRRDGIRQSMYGEAVVEDPKPRSGA